MKALIPIACVIVLMAGCLQRTCAQQVASGATNDALQNIFVKQHAFSQYCPLEKAYLHFDKPYYITGETVYFKVYATLGNNFLPDTLSRTIHVEMLDTDGNPLHTQQLELQYGCARGTIEIPSNYEPGVYKIRAYTHWMRNFSESPLFEKMITIYSAIAIPVKWEVHTVTTEAEEADSLKVALTVLDSAYRPIAGSYNYVLKVKGMKHVTGSSATNSKGQDELIFALPKKNKAQLGEISFMTENGFGYQGHISLLPSSAKVTFFPEGGNMVEGIRQRVAFKITDEKGFGVSASGTVENSRGETVASFSDYHAGMGAFYITPHAGETYIGKVRTASGRLIEQKLPETFPQGYVMETHFAEQDDSVRFYIKRHGFDRDTRVGLLLQSSGKVLWNGKLRMSRDSIYLAITKEALPSGVMQFTLFQENGAPVCERLVFVNQHTGFNIRISTDKTGFDKREKIALHLEVTDQDGQPVQGSFSIAVTDQKQVIDTARFQNNILTHMLLNSEIRGNIENPGYYFAAETEHQRLALEYLLMTQGWRRFRWDQALKDQFLIKYPVEKGLTITGTIRNITTHKVMPDHEVSMLIQNRQGIEVGSAITSKTGRFRFFPDFYGEAKVTIQTKNKNNRLIERRIDIEEETFMADSVVLAALSTQTSLIADRKLEQSQSAIDAYRKTYGMMQRYLAEQDSIIKSYDLEAVEVRAKEIITPDYGKVAQKIINVGEEMSTLRNDLNFRITNILDFLSYTYPEKFITILNEDGESIRYAQGRKMSGGYRDLVYVVNDMAVDPELIMSEDVMCYNKIEVVDQSGLACIYATGDYGNDFECETAVVIVIHRRPDGSCANMNTGIRNYTMQGYAIAKEFYSPDYEKADKDSAIPDIRSTVYWNPNVVTDQDGKATLYFFQNDVGGYLRAKVEGMSLNGFTGAGYSEYVF